MTLAILGARSFLAEQLAMSGEQSRPEELQRFHCGLRSRRWLGAWMAAMPRAGSFFFLFLENSDSFFTPLIPSQTHTAAVDRGFSRQFSTAWLQWTNWIPVAVRGTLLAAGKKIGRTRIGERKQKRIERDSSEITLPSDGRRRAWIPPRSPLEQAAGPNTHQYSPFTRILTDRPQDRTHIILTDILWAAASRSVQYIVLLRSRLSNDVTNQ
jgi:hypothetical protein